MSAAEPIKLPLKQSRAVQGSQELLKAHSANELVFAVVGHVGSGTSSIAKTLEVLLSRPNNAGRYEVTYLKARDVIVEWGKNKGHLKESESLERRDIQHTIKLQDLGDEMRRSDPTAVARALVDRIRRARASMQGSGDPGQDPVKPDRTPRAYIIDALRHPAEAHFLRSLYRNAFALIGVVCQEDTRQRRIVRKYKNAGDEYALEFMERDAKDTTKKYGQRVSDTFHLADFFIDNSEERNLSEAGRENESNPDWNVPDKLLRLVRIITHSEIERPTMAETAMHFAYGAQMRSACMSRQVGAALVDSAGNVVATGSNEVPKAGGGLYGPVFDDVAPGHDHRCAYNNKYCSNTREQTEIVEELLKLMPESLDGEARKALQQKLRGSRIGGLLEFSRAVHAEMDALLSAGRTGKSTLGCRLFVTTFPCHYCARHIVGAGVDEVQYIEPYPKSRALKLHGDSITHSARAWTAPSNGGTRVLIRPFTGVAPRLYWRAFLKDRELKSEGNGNLQMGAPDWGTAWDIPAVSYVELEAKLLEESEVSRG